MTHAIVALLLLVTTTSVWGLSCRGFPIIDGKFTRPSAINDFTKEQWWAFIKPIDSAAVTYFSPSIPQGISSGQIKSDSSAFELFEEIILDAKVHNDVALKAYQKFVVDQFGADRKKYADPSVWQDKFDEFAEDIDQIREDINAWQVWFNDQPESWGASKNKFDREKKEYPHGHSKYILTVSLDGTEATLVQHSFPTLPAALYSDEEISNFNEWNSDYKLFDERNVMIKTQHAVCVRLKSANEVLQVLELLRVARPKVVAMNFHYRFIQKPKNEDRKWVNKLVDIIHGGSLDDMKKKCENFWKKVVNQASTTKWINSERGPIWKASYNIIQQQISHYGNFKHRLGPAVNEASEYGPCSKVFNILANEEPDDGIAHETAITMMSTVPQNKLDKKILSFTKEKDEKNTKVSQKGINLVKSSPKLKEGDVLTAWKSVFELGPAHWLALSQYLGVPLHLSFWKNDPLPPISTPQFGVQTVAKRVLFSKASTHGQFHEKVGSSSHSPTELMFYNVNIDGERIPITVATDYIGNGAPLQMIQNGPNKTPRLVIFDFYSTKKMTTASTFAVEAEGGPPATWTEYDYTFQSYGTQSGYIRIVDWSTGTCFTGDSSTFVQNPLTGVFEPKWTRRLIDATNTMFIFFRLRHLYGPLISSANFRLQLIDNKKTVYNYSPSWSDLPSENNTMSSVRFNILASLTPNIELPFTELRIQMLGDRRFAATKYEISGIFVARTQSSFNSEVFTTYASGYRAELTSKSSSYISIPLMRAKK